MRLHLIHGSMLTVVNISSVLFLCNVKLKEEIRINGVVKSPFTITWQICQERLFLFNV